MKKRIGEHFVGLNILSFEQCEIILEFQKKHPHMMFGEIAIELKYLIQEDMQNYLNES